MKGLKPPYLLLGNHNAFLDFKTATVAIFPHRASNIVAIDGFLKREWLLRAVGCVCKRKFTSDMVLIKHLMKLIKRGEIVTLYPEARYSLCGTTAIIPDSLGKLVKHLHVPVVTLITRGHHINSPFWNLTERNNRTEADMTQIITADEIEELTVEQIMSRINKAFVYDDFKWQLDNRISVTYPKRAEGLHKVLYQCPHCMKEYMMSSEGTILTCNSCHKQWNMNEYGQLEALDKNTEFSHIPDWYEWERKQVRDQIDAGTYCFDKEVRIDSLPNAVGYVDLGDGRLIHNKDGFTLTGISDSEQFKMEWPAKILYSCHIEFDYLGKYGDCVDLNTLTDTLYIYPKGNDFSVTKLSLATEELYKKYNGK
jgi:transposase-like protein